MHASADKPLVTFAVIAFNQEPFIRAAVLGALAQDYAPLEIILSDDCSRDGTFEIIRALADAYRGPHRIIVNRNERNLGLGGHVNAVVAMSSGRLIVLAGGDDISLPGRTRASQELMDRHPDCLCLSFERIVIRDGLDAPATPAERDHGLTTFTLDDFVSATEHDRGLQMHGASRCFRTSVFETFGPLAPDTPTEDSTILLRSLLAGRVLKSLQQQVVYRIHGGNYAASDNRYRIDYARIHRQYMSDLQTAVASGLISPERAARVEACLTRKLRRLQAWAGFHRSGNKWWAFFTTILFSSAFGLTEKKEYFRTAMQSTRSSSPRRSKTSTPRASRPGA